MKKIKVAIFSLCAMFMGLYFVGNSIKVDAEESSNEISTYGLSGGVLSSLYDDCLVYQNQVADVYLMKNMAPYFEIDVNAEKMYFVTDSYTVGIGRNESIWNLYSAVIFENVFNSGFDMIYAQKEDQVSSGVALPIEFDGMSTIYSNLNDKDAMIMHYDVEGAIDFSVKIDDEVYYDGYFGGDYCEVQNLDNTLFFDCNGGGNKVEFTWSGNGFSFSHSSDFVFLDSASFMNYYYPDSTPPVFNGSTTNYISNVDNPLTEEYILSTITATDETSGNCSTYVKYTNYNPNVLGQYYMTIGARDTAGNEATKDVYINVVDITAPTALGGTTTTNNTVLADVQSILESFANVTDNYFNSFTYQIISDNYSANYKVAGTYEIRGLVTENRENGLSCEVTIQIVNKDWIQPTWETSPSAIAWDNKSKLTQEVLLSYFKAKDESCTPRLFLKEDQSGYYNGESYLVAKIYGFEIGAEDAAGNTITCHVDVVVSDKVAPIITGEASKNVSYTQKITSDEIINLLTATDETATTLVITLVEDKYSDNFTELGSYVMKFKTSDGFNDSAIYEFTIVVIDNIAPILAGSTNLQTTNLEKDYLTKEQIVSRLTINDKSSYTTSLVDKNEYLTNQKKVGIYNFTITVTDVFDNTASFDFTLTVNDKIAPELTITDMKYVIVLQENEVLTQEQIIALLSQIGVVASTNDIVGVNCAYFDSFEKGDYDCEIQLVSGESHIITLRNIGIDIPEPTEPEELGFWAKVGKFFKDIWNALCNFFSNVWDYGIYNTCSFVANIGQVFDFKSDLSFGERCKNAYFAWANKKADEVEIPEATTITSTVLKMEM